MRSPPPPHPRSIRTVCKNRSRTEFRESFPLVSLFHSIFPDVSSFLFFSPFNLHSGKKNFVCVLIRERAGVTRQLLFRARNILYTRDERSAGDRGDGWISGFPERGGKRRKEKRVVCSRETSFSRERRRARAGDGTYWLPRGYGKAINSIKYGTLTQSSRGEPDFPYAQREHSRAR